MENSIDPVVKKIMKKNLPIISEQSVLFMVWWWCEFQDKFVTAHQINAKYPGNRKLRSVQRKIRQLKLEGKVIKEGNSYQSIYKLNL